MKIIVAIVLLVLCSLAGVAQKGMQPDEEFYRPFCRNFPPPEIDLDRVPRFKNRVMSTIDKAKTGINWPAGSAHVLLFPIYTAIVDVKVGKTIPNNYGQSEFDEL